MTFMEVYTYLFKAEHSLVGGPSLACGASHAQRQRHRLALPSVCHVKQDAKLSTVLDLPCWSMAAVWAASLRQRGGLTREVVPQQHFHFRQAPGREMRLGTTAIADGNGSSAATAAATAAAKYATGHHAPPLLTDWLPISVLTDSYKTTHYLQYPACKKMVAVRLPGAWTDSSPSQRPLRPAMPPVQHSSQRLE